MGRGKTGAWGWGRMKTQDRKGYKGQNRIRVVGWRSKDKTEKNPGHWPGARMDKGQRKSRGQ